MKKILLVGAAFTYLCTPSCKKADDGMKPYNAWKVGGTEYTAQTVTKSSASGAGFITASAGGGSSASSINFYFNTLPTTTGSYSIVGMLSGSGDQVQVLTASNSGGKMSAYSSVGNDNMKATITVNSGKISITMPPANARNMSGGNDTLKVSATAISAE